MVINPIDDNDRHDIKLNNGWLAYKSTFVYLGVIFSDSGAVSTDVNLHALQREKSVYVKLANFMRNNEAAPIIVKQKVLKSCLNASLLYGCEAWSSSSVVKIETLYRKTIKVTFSVSMRTPNEIVFLETGLNQLKAEIYKRQYNFWSKLLKNIESDPQSSVALIFKMSIEKNVHYIRQYQKLHKKFENAIGCYKFHVNEFELKNKDTITTKAAPNTYGIIKDYVALNNNLHTPNFYHQYSLFENERLIVTKYRSGSHFLKINTGSFYRTPLDERLCACNEIQTLHHVIFHCVLTAPIRYDGFPQTLGDFFDNSSNARTTR